VWRTYGITVVLVTHDIDEAVYLADRVVVLSASPMTVRETLSVDLPRPRDQITTKELPEFAHLRAHVFAQIRESVRVGPNTPPPEPEQQPPSPHEPEPEPQQQVPT
jgi:NitT/TauT family transport system ATP-binding protein